MSPVINGPTLMPHANSARPCSNGAPQCPSPPNPQCAARLDSLEFTLGPRTKRYLRCRRALDIVVAGTLLLLCAPLLATLIVLIRLTSRGSAIYSQRRVGLNGQVFTIYKLRSMRMDAERTTGAVWSLPGDPRVTLIGRFLRWTHFDELPQLANILRGDMALIGPRPERPEIVADLAQRIPHYLDRLKVLPGVTGLAQVSLPPDTDLQSVRRKTALDRRYAESVGLGLDLHILFCTLMMLFGLQRRVDARAWQLFTNSAMSV